MPKQITVNLQIPPSYKAALQDYADELSLETGEIITISTLCRKAIKDFLRSIDRLPKKGGYNL